MRINKNRKIRIMHILRSGGYSGAEKVVISIIKNMQDSCDAVYVSPSGYIDKILRQERIKYFSIKKVTVFEIARAAKIICPDIIQAHDYYNSMIAACLPIHIPIICHLHNNAPWIKNYGFKSTIFALSCMRYKEILTVSDSICEEYIWGKYIQKKTKTIGNPIDTNEIIKKSEVGIETDPFEIAYIGRLSVPKNPVRFLHIIKHIQSFLPNITCKMIGDGELKEKILDEINILGLKCTIEILGFKENPYSILKNGKILCITSDWEGFGLVAVEALALGVPVVCTNVGGLPQLVDEKCGFICNTNHEMEVAIKRLLTDDSLYMSLHNVALSKAKELDNINQYMSRMLEIYLKIFNKTNSGLQGNPYK